MDFFASIIIGRGARGASDAGRVGDGIDVGYLTSAGAVHTSIATSTITRIRAMGPMCPTAPHEVGTVRHGQGSNRAAQRSFLLFGKRSFSG